jgi:hypothetical protein
LASVTAYTLSDGQLILSDPTGGQLVFREA